MRDTNTHTKGCAGENANGETITTLGIVKKPRHKQNNNSAHVSSVFVHFFVITARLKRETFYQSSQIGNPLISTLFRVTKQYRRQAACINKSYGCCNEILCTLGTLGQEYRSTLSTDRLLIGRIYQLIGGLTASMLVNQKVDNANRYSHVTMSWRRRIGQMLLYIIHLIISRLFSFTHVTRVFRLTRGDIDEKK